MAIVTHVSVNGSDRQKPTIQPEMVSPKTLAAMWDLKVERIREWVKAARSGKLSDPFPFKQFPGSRMIRIPLKPAREWCDRYTARGNHMA